MNTPADYIARIIELESELAAERVKYRQLFARYHQATAELADAKAARSVHIYHDPKMP